MALIKPVRIRTPYDADILVYKWGPATENDTFEALPFGRQTDVTFKTEGTFGGATYGLEGSLEAETDPPTKFVALKDPQGTAISHGTDAGDIDGVQEACYWYRPVRTGGTGVSVNIYLFGK